MPLLSCPNSEQLFEFVSISQEMSWARRTSFRVHNAFCQDCHKKSADLQKTWQSYFTPEPDITSSLMRVYSRLQNDETLILKGWKLGELPRPRSASDFLLGGGWLFRGAVSVAAMVILVLLVSSQMGTERPEHLAANTIPFAQIRYENENSVQVQYVKPELLQTIEFETTSGQ